MILPADAPRPAPEPLRILVVEDDVGTLEGIGTFLKRGGYNVTVARDGTSAHRALLPRPSVVIVDNRLPDMNGLDLIESLCKAVPDLPVILVTSWPNPALYAEAMQRGAATCLSQPFSLWNFWITLQQILRAAWMPGAPPWRARKSLRVSLEAPLTAHRERGGRAWHAQLRDLSHTGAMIVIPAQIEPGQTLILTLPLPNRRLEVEASVIWAREDALHPGVYLYGLAFTKPQDLEFAQNLARRFAPPLSPQVGPLKAGRRPPPRAPQSGRRAALGTGRGRRSTAGAKTPRPTLPNRVRAK
jgi:CheY-like chemotaxis protein